MPTSFDTPTAAPDLLSRLDALRGWLKLERLRIMTIQDRRLDVAVARIDEHLATVDDACEALQQ